MNMATNRTKKHPFGVYLFHYVDSLGLRRRVACKDATADLYRAAGTAQEEEAFEPYLAVIGLSGWDIVQEKIAQ